MKRKDEVILYASLISITIDQTTKLLIWVSDFPFKLNSGVILGVFQSNFLVSALTLILHILVALIAYFKIKGNFLGLVGLGLFVGGGLSNSLDRFFRGSVIDWIDLKFWPIFNLADVAIVAGLLLIGYDILGSKNESENFSR